jgi:hypothetical protein
MGYIPINQWDAYREVVQQAKKLEKKQIIDAANGYSTEEYLGVTKGEQYYKEKYE